MDNDEKVAFRGVGELYEQSISRLEEDVQDFFHRMARETSRLSKVSPDIDHRPHDIVVYPMQQALGHIAYRLTAQIGSVRQQQNIMGVAQQLGTPQDFSLVYFIETHQQAGLWRVGPADMILSSLLSLYYFEDLRDRRGIIKPHETDTN